MDNVTTTEWGSKLGLPGIRLTDYSFLRPGVWLSMDTGDWSSEYFEVCRVTSEGYGLQWIPAQGGMTITEYRYTTYPDPGEWLIWAGGTRKQLRQWLSP